MKTFTVINQKGGTGKTSTVLNIADYLALKGFKVLLIDLDSQCNLTFSENIRNPQHTMYTLFEGKSRLEQVITGVSENIRILPSSPLLANTTLKRVDKLKEIVEQVKKEYKFDYCIIDTPPALSILTINALTRTEEIIITAQADMYSMQGISNLYETVNAVKAHSNPDIKIKGILITRFDKRSKISKAMLNQITGAATIMGTRVFDTQIRECIAVKEAQRTFDSIYAYKNNANTDYTEFIEKEILNNG